MAVLNNSNAISPSGYDINNSLRFRASASAYLTRTLGSASSRTTWTYSFWFKRGLMGGTYYLLSNGNGNANNTEESLYFESTNQLTFINVTQNVAVNWSITTTQVFRDPSAWYHLVIAVDTTQATAANRIKFYVNGSQITSFSSASYPAQNANMTQGASGLTNEIGRRAQVSSNYNDCYYAEFNFVTGQQLTPSSFGATDATTGVWQPAKYTGTYGTNGYYLKFSDIATTSGSNAGLGKDFSGNGNYFNTNNISVTSGTTYDAMTDSPTNTSATVANYAVLNPLRNPSTATLSESNLRMSASSSAEAYWNATIAYPTTGKWWFDFVCVSGPNIGGLGFRTADSTNSMGTSSFLLNEGGYVYVNGSTSYNIGSWGVGDVIGLAIDMDNSTYRFYKNGTALHSAVSFTKGTETWFPFAGLYNASNVVNFGQRPWAYAPPTGYKAINTYNLPDSTIKKGNSVMDATIWTGNGGNRTITNGGFRPDLLWIKKRNSAFNHRLNNTITGTTATLFTNNTDAETTWGGLDGFTANGFTISGDTSVNNNGDTYVAWQWNAGSGSTSSNTQGSITSTVSVSASAGFSIVTYTGTGANATVGHGLGVAPKMIIAKCRGAASQWGVYHANVDATPQNYALLLNSTAAKELNSLYWNNTAPTSTVFSLGGSSAANTSGQGQVAYCWAEIAGFSKFGSYTGNGSTDGPFVYTGFRPKFVLIKRTDSADVWWMFDSTRNPSNPDDLYLWAQSSQAEAQRTGSTTGLDLLSNGFKLKDTSTGLNASGGTYIYMTFAENPFKNALAR